MNFVQGFVTNCNIPRDFDDFCNIILGDYIFPIEDVLESEYIEFTAARWCMPNDICFFMFAQSSKEIVGHHRAQLSREKNYFSKQEFKKLQEGIIRAEALISKYRGSIFSVGRVSGDNIYDDEVNAYWKSNIYAGVEDVINLDNPVYIADFSKFLFISRGGVITPVLGEEFTKLQKLILAKNKMPEWFCESKPIEISLFVNQKNDWLIIGKNFINGFILEKQLRSYFVDKLLKDISDNHSFYEECECIKAYYDRKSAPRVDYVIKFEEKYLGVETKLSIHNEVDLEGQLDQYVNVERVICKGKDIIKNIDEYYQENVLVIDKQGLYMFSANPVVCKNARIFDIFSYAQLTEKITADVIRNIIKEYLEK